ncbi:MAG: cyclic nucleotide-binding domain-containing protein [Burkholderiaceae bacterium]|nr:cyclic nucleotide-binding domain-containing protein [Rhodoferax sp.]MCP5270356.1 cyclic nucleotide-binding domain-containing protein [Burkholderiaceae bacterium]
MADDFFQYGGAVPAPSPAPTDSAVAPPAPRLLAELGDADWAHLIGFMARRRYPAGAVILAVGQLAPALVFVANGHLRVTVPGQPSERRGEGDVAGMLGFLDAAPAAAEVVAETEVDLLMLTPQALQQLGAWQPRIALALLRDLAAHVALRLRRLQPAD